MNFATLINRSLILFASVSILSLLFSCNEGKNKSKKQDTLYYKVDVNDEFINKVITTYADSNKLDPKKTVLSLNIKTDSYRTMLYVRHSRAHFEKYSRLPSYYTFIGEYLVLLYSDMNSFIKNERLQDELMHLYDDRQLDLVNEVFIDDYPTWKITKCEDHISVMRTSDELELPCFLKFGVKEEQIVIEEEGWFKELKKSKSKSN